MYFIGTITIVDAGHADIDGSLSQSRAQIRAISGVAPSMHSSPGVDTASKIEYLAMIGDAPETNVPLVAGILPWLEEASAHFYPDSTYARDLPMEIRDRGRCQTLSRPWWGGQGTSPSL